MQFQHLPASTVHEVKRRLLDSFGCALGAIHAPPVAIARTLARTVTSTQPATVFGTTHVTSPEWAAFANGTAIRYLDYNDTYLSLEPAHPSDNFAAVLAAAEPARADGRAIITAAALAYEVQCRMCDSASIRARGWDHVTYGSFSTSLAAGKLFGLSEPQLVHAQGLAGTPNNAMRQTRVGELSMWKGCAFANASRNGLFAAQLAREGMTGPAPIFEGQMGFFNQVSGPMELDVDEFGGADNEFMIDRTYIKLYPAEYHSQSAIDAALILRRQVNDPAEIHAVLIHSFDAAVDIIGGEPEKWRPQSRETADHSLPYCVAAALLDGEVTRSTFARSRYTEPAVLDLTARTRVEREAGLSARYPEGIPNRLTVKLRSGQTLTQEVTYPRGHAGNKMTDDEVVAKFTAMARPLLPAHRLNEAVDRTMNLERESGIAGLMGLFALPEELLSRQLEPEE